MFCDSNRPFYMTSNIVELDAIDREVYTDFAIRNFKRSDKSLSKAIVERVYDTFDGLTFALQLTMEGTFMETAPGTVCTDDIIDNAITRTININAFAYRELLSVMPEKQKMLLYAIALEGKAETVLIKEHRLNSTSFLCYHIVEHYTASFHWLKKQPV